MKKVFLLLICIIFLCSCSKTENVTGSKPEVLKATNLYLQTDKDYVKELLKNNNVGNVDVFLNWVDHFNIASNQKCGVNTTWTSINDIKYDEIECANKYEKKYQMSDGDCRITAFALIEKDLQMSKKIQDEGTYLMFDMDVIDNNKDYKLVKNKRDDFVTLFNEINISNVGDKELQNVFSNKWKEYGIKINNEKVSLISLVIEDPDSKVLFVGHTGVLIHLEDKIMFIEKIAFEQPYQITLLNNMNELFDMFSKRKEYFGGEKENGPFVYENDKLVHTY